MRATSMPRIAFAALMAARHCHHNVERTTARLALVVLAMLVLVSASATSAQDKIAGAAWLITFSGGGKENMVRFRATPDGKVYDRGSEIVGSWKGDNAKTEMEITGFKEKKQAIFNGTYVLTNISNGPIPRWSGKWTPPGGTKSKNVHVRLLKD